MRRSFLVGLGIAVPVLLLAAEAAAQTAWAQDAFETACYQFVSSENSIPVPAVPAPLKALAATQRKAAVEALGARAKAYFASEAFKKRWIQNHGGDYRDPEEANRKAKNEEMQKQGQAQANKQLAEVEKMMPMMPPEVQAQMRANLAKAKADQAKQQAKKQARSDAKAPAREAVAVPDAKVALRQALERFLRVSEGVDYDAPLTHQNNRAHFSNPAYEAKPDAWKASFRAGRSATEAARSYVRAWLAELK